ncbi:MAG: bifunctional folylpolyglutamate synthase/dihydrofolate synthase [Minwuia sp.]|nr:bifunctional folylpolyglutamate synthase/dihydrofolate synthase [Minwuia sp.]
MKTPLTDAVLARIGALGAARIALDLDRLPGLLDRLGAPHRRLPPVVHVAGTNGKGSVVAYLHDMLRAQGLTVQRYVSPYLVRPTEQVLLADGEVDDAVYAAALERVEVANAGAPLPVFEAMTAAAFICFADDPADVLLLECGMGGRLDSTNVAEGIAVSVVTPVALDHMAFLGPDIASIAAEKAGIFRPGVPVVANPQDSDAIQVMRQHAAASGAPFLLAAWDWTVEPKTGAYRGQGQFTMPQPGMAGEHQWFNAGLALRALEVLADRVDRVAPPDDRQVAVIADTHVPARLHRVAGADEREIWVDGGHNQHAALAVASAMRQLPSRPLVLIVGLLDNRPAAPFLAAFSDMRPRVIGVPVPSGPVYAVGQATAPARIAAAAKDLDLAGSAASDWRQALAMVDRRHRVLITGSLYLVGEVLDNLPHP